MLSSDLQRLGDASVFSCLCYDLLLAALTMIACGVM